MAHGLRLVDQNVAVRGGEIDLIMADGESLVAVEVRAITRDGDPIDAIDWAKRDHVGRIATSRGVSRTDFLGVGFRSWGVEVHWVPG